VFFLDIDYGKEKTALVLFVALWQSFWGYSVVYGMIFGNEIGISFDVLKNFILYLSKHIFTVISICAYTNILNDE